jgi:PAS domain S-box-containing protein
VQALVRTRVAEDAMRRSEAKFRAIYDQVSSGIGLLDQQGRFIDVNPAMLALMERAAEAVVGRSLSSFVPPEWVQQVDACTRQVSRAPDRHEFPILTPDGRLVTLEWRISAHIEPQVSMAVATDISERVLLEQQRQHLLDRERVARGEAEQVSRMKDDFIAVLSHELRTPLNAIMGWTHVLQKRGGSEETLRGLAAIERNGHMQARMIADLLDMSRLNLGKLPLSLETFDPADAVVAALNAMRPSVDENANQLIVDINPPYRMIRADSSRLQQIVWNLLSNAIKFSPRGGHIRVALVQEDTGLHIRVSDEGQGIAPDFLPLMFDRFSQGTVGSNRRRGGLGLGLSIVKQLVEAHGGSISAESAGVGQGASFDVWLPADSAVGETGESVDDETTPGELDALDGTEMPLAGARLLVVEDDPEARGMLQLILGDHGAIVRSAASCDEALALLADGDMLPDLLVSDIGMPGKDGYDLIRELRRREASTTNRLPAIALTSFARAHDQAQALAAGFDAHCAKPLRPLKLVRQIEQLLERRGFRSTR